MTSMATTAQQLLPLLQRGTYTRADIESTTGLSQWQIRDAWRWIKINYAEPHELICSVNPITHTYALGQDPTIAAASVSASVRDTLTRLATIDKAQLAGMRRNGGISARAYRAFVMAREEYEEQGAKLAEKLASAKP